MSARCDPIAAGNVGGFARSISRPRCASRRPGRNTHSVTCAAVGWYPPEFAASMYRKPRDCSSLKISTITVNTTCYGRSRSATRSMGVPWFSRIPSR